MKQRDANAHGALCDLNSTGTSDLVKVMEASQGLARDGVGLAARAEDALQTIAESVDAFDRKRPNTRLTIRIGVFPSCRVVPPAAETTAIHSHLPHKRGASDVLAQPAANKNDGPQGPPRLSCLSTTGEFCRPEQRPSWAGAPTHAVATPSRFRRRRRPAGQPSVPTPMQERRSAQCRTASSSDPSR